MMLCFVQKYPESKRFKRKGLAHFDQLKEIFAGKSATGGLAMGPAEVAAIGRAATSAREMVPCVSAAGSAPDAEEGGDSSDEAREVEKQPAEKSTPGRFKRKSPMSSQSMWQAAIQSQTESERYSSDRMIAFLEEKEARRLSTHADSMTRDEVLMTQCVEKLTKYRESLSLQKYSSFMMELVNKKDLRHCFMSIPDEAALPFLQGLRDDY